MTLRCYPEFKDSDGLVLYPKSRLFLTPRYSIFGKSSVDPRWRQAHTCGEVAACTVTSLPNTGWVECQKPPSKTTSHAASETRIVEGRLRSADAGTIRTPPCCRATPNAYRTRGWSQGSELIFRFHGASLAIIRVHRGHSSQRKNRATVNLVRHPSCPGQVLTGFGWRRRYSIRHTLCPWGLCPLESSLSTWTTEPEYQTAITKRKGKSKGRRLSIGRGLSKS